MLKRIIKASEATAPYNRFDSIVEIPSGSNPQQNARLTLQLRVKLNFCDSKNAASAGNHMVQDNGRTFARDWNGYLFPALDWTDDLKDKFMKGFVKKAEGTWNYQYVLLTPDTYSDLDYLACMSSRTPLKVRPNVLCLLRVAVIGPSGLIDNTPAAGPLRTGAPHMTINVFNLDKSVTSVKLASGVAATADNPATKRITTFDDGAFRSDDYDYDDSDLFRPRVVDAANKVMHSTIGHEIGHAIGQTHILGLQGDAACAFDAPTVGDNRCYGAGSDSWDIMGRGDRLYLINAVSWKERMALHSGLPSTNWPATGVMTTPPRSIPAAIADTSFAPSKW